MSTEYKNSADVPNENLAARLSSLADVVRKRDDAFYRHREFSMSIPAEYDRDFDIVMTESARRLNGIDSTESQLKQALQIMDRLQSEHASIARQNHFLRCTISHAIFLLVNYGDYVGSGEMCRAEILKTLQDSLLRDSDAEAFPPKLEPEV